MRITTMRLELDAMNATHSSYNTYVDVGSLNPNGKRVVYRTKSEPIYSRTHVNYSKRMMGQRSLPEYKEATVPISSQETQDSVTNRTVYIVLESQTEYCKIKGSTATTFTNNRLAKAKLLKSDSKKSAHKRSSSISEGDLTKARYTTAAQYVHRQRTEQDSALSSDSMFTASAVSSQPTSKETGLSRTVITKQPQSAKNGEPSCDIQSRDNCFRCLKVLQNVVNCCTCLWCFDACCYHCFKDDVGYTSWFKEMLSCNKRPVENIQQWSLFGLATVAFPCILLYPILGGAVNQCLKCRLAKHHSH